MLKLPAPEVDGLNIPLETNVPLYVPPAGKPPVRGNVRLLVQTPYSVSEITGKLLIVAVTAVLGDVHPPAVAST